MILSTTNLQLLQEVPLFRDIDQDHVLMRLAANLEEVDYPAEHPIVIQDQGGAHLYIIATGSVKVHLDDAVIARLGIGAHFGEISLFDGQPASASVTTLEPTKCLVLDRQQVLQAIHDCPELGLSLIRGLTRRLRRMTQRLGAWMRGLLTIAWADGQYTAEEKHAIAALIHTEIYPQTDLGELHPISGQELAAVLEPDGAGTENFLRAAMIVALANGTYSEAEDRILREFCRALGQPTAMLDALKVVLVPTEPSIAVMTPEEEARHRDLLQPVRQWLDEMEIDSPHTARFLCKLIPAQCPFERDIVLFGHKIVHIPPMCKLNPLYDQLVGLRFRSLSYLADECHEDITPYLS